MQIIDGQQIALKITQKIAKNIFNSNNERRPGLAIILAGDREDSNIYVNIKQERAKEVGIDTHLYKIKDIEETKDVLELIKHLNGDDEIDGILVQLPLPEKYDTDKIIAAIDYKKDVDCFHTENVKLLSNYKNQKPFILSPVYASVLEILENIYFDLKNSVTVIVANSEIFGNGLQSILVAEGSKAEVVFREDELFKEKIKKADLLITAVGKRKLIMAEMIKPGAVVIDIGISKEGGKLYGDVDFDETKEMASAITPVPGGVGPVVVAKVLENTWKIANKKEKSV
jgi:5,10-methylene-tetrahydrofolate dehydrogenase/methenyl tetrahydrofolate cyclohydrolase